MTNSPSDQVKYIERARPNADLGIQGHVTCGDPVALAKKSKNQRIQRDLKYAAESKTFMSRMPKVLIYIILLPFFLAGIFFIIALLMKLFFIGSSYSPFTSTAG